MYGLGWLQGKQSRTDSMDAQWRAAAHGYAAQVLHPERYPLPFHGPLHTVSIRFLFGCPSRDAMHRLPA